MSHVTLNTLTDTVSATFDALPDTRRRELLQQLVRHLHAFARSTRLSHAEWRAALAFMHRVGDISSDSRSEFSLLSDVLGLSSLVDLLASAPDATPGSVLGPFHTAGSPWRDNPVDLSPGNAGEQVRLQGRVIAADGTPLAGAVIDFWQNADNGLYWQMDPSQPQDNLRCRLLADANGGFDITTIRPRPYQIPTDGPVWRDVVEPAGRSPWRPAHLHLIVSASGYRSLVTELFDAGDPWLETDAVFGVRDGLLLRFAPVPGSALPVATMDLKLAQSADDGGRA